MRTENQIQLTAFEKDQMPVIIEYINGHLHLPLTAEMIAGAFSISSYKLQAAFLILTGKSLVLFIKETRMEAARNLLLTTNSPLKEIAGLCGYHHYNSFLRAFKNHFFITPNRFRRKKL